MSLTTSILEHCSTLIEARGTLMTTFFLGGLTGGFTHCVVMCGAINLTGQKSCNGGCKKLSCSGNKLSQLTQPTYHLGRLTMYVALGFIAASFGHVASTLPHWSVLSTMLLVLAGGMFIINSLPGCNHLHNFTSGRFGYAAGLLTGLMPCGLLYAALILASTLADPIMGVVGMGLFTLGTLPALLLIRSGAELIAVKWQSTVLAFGRLMMAASGISLLLRATKLVM